MLGGLARQGVPNLMLSYLKWPIFFTAIGLALAAWLGWYSTGSASGAFSFLLIGTVLAILEISLSFDNAIVNANKLNMMTPEWQHRFLTWGIVIAVFGMRIVFPLAVVAVAAKISPWAALKLAAVEPQEYGRIMEESHVAISAFGGAFLMMVGLTYFIDVNKEVHWIEGLEGRLRRWGSIRGMEIALVLLVVIVFASLQDDAQVASFLYAAVFGLIVFQAVEILGHVLDKSGEANATAAAGGLGAFLYLEVLDASFSFDGVIGAFALTKNLFLIAIGLGIGAFYVRSMTIMLVEKGTLAEFRYLEHGAFYSIVVLAAIMFAQSVVHVSEIVTGLIGATLIGISLWSSIRWNRANPHIAE